jgi:hypothetical protein
LIPRADVAVPAASEQVLGIRSRSPLIGRRLYGALGIELLVLRFGRNISHRFAAPLVEGPVAGTAIYGTLLCLIILAARAAT